MTIRELLGVVLRRWYVVVIVVLCAALATFAFMRDGGSYTTRTLVTFMLPEKTIFAPGNGLDDASVIGFAGSVAQELNEGKAPRRYSEDGAPLYGAGAREQTLVTLANAGNQWVASYLRAEIEIQIVGRTEEEVTVRQAEMIDRALQVTDSQQDMLGIPEESRISASVVPLSLQVEHVAPNRMQQILAAAAMLAASVLVGFWLSVALDRTLRRPRARRTASALTATPAKGIAS
ncbi:hypothetical protein [Microbacterium sp. SLBN-146]|uniref:hypothetical protein n=1 Tax=Microbacterium sp. SLBN-146 TaxID=2768457 RepID=UPI001154E908|nr:hypothetical protein [Microbacterium sp. SLBN-146]TQJ30603.1 hypothetical protein FBY39_1056 [Microbacterium sp. SLBN-146]